MLPTRSIPIYGDDDPDDWHTFLYKAAKGSIKALDTLTSANMAYMVAFTGDPSAPDTMHLEDYNVLVHERFPQICPIDSIEEFYHLANGCGWIAEPFQISESPYNAANEYSAIWGRSPVAEFALMNDSMLYCLDCWSPSHFVECVDHQGINYDSRTVTTGMLYLSVTWPGMK
jgi:hypothetical protein